MCVCVLHKKHNGDCRPYMTRVFVYTIILSDGGERNSDVEVYIFISSCADMKMSKVGNQTNSQDPQAVNSRVFVGNLNTFQCSKTDVERMFQRYGRLVGEYSIIRRARNIFDSGFLRRARNRKFSARRTRPRTKGRAACRHENVTPNG